MAKILVDEATGFCSVGKNMTWMELKHHFWEDSQAWTNACIILTYILKLNSNIKTNTNRLKALSLKI